MDSLLGVYGISIDLKGSIRRAGLYIGGECEEPNRAWEQSKNFGYNTAGGRDQSECWLRGRATTS